MSSLFDLQRSALFLPLIAATTTWADEAPTFSECAGPAKLAAPARDLPTAADRRRLRDCDSEALYYGIGAEADFVAARKCALIEAENPDPGPGIFGAGVLMMIYANGRGVPQDLDLARKYACAMWSAPAELTGRLDHLQRIADGDESTEPFDLCDDVTSGVMGGFCTAREERKSSVGRHDELTKIQASWSAPQLEAFRALRTAADGYFTESMNQEVDQSGTLRAAFMTEHGAALEDELLGMLREFETGKLPQGDAAAYATDDRELNAVYAKVLKAAAHEAGESFGPLGTIDPAGIRKVEVAWLRYRDAWVVFGASRYPPVAKAAWLGFLTRQRTKALKALMGDEP